MNTKFIQFDYHRHSGIATLRDLPDEDTNKVVNPLTVASFMVRESGLYGICVTGDVTGVYSVGGSFVTWNVPEDPLAPRSLPELEDDFIEYICTFDPDIVAYRRLHGSQKHKLPAAKPLLKMIRRLSTVPWVSVNTLQAGVAAKDLVITTTDKPAKIAKKLMLTAFMAIQMRSEKAARSAQTQAKS